jgi:AcrR family transcriptional regulator
VARAAPEEAQAEPRRRPPPDDTARPRSAKGTRTRERLLEAAKVVFERDGFLDARVADISEQAGLSHGSFYYYFDSKEQIFREVAASLDERLGAPLGEVVFDPSSSLSPGERLREAIHRHFASYRDESAILGLVEEVSRYDEMMAATRRERHQRYTEEMARSIRRLQGRDVTDPDLDPVVTATALGALVLDFAETWLVHDALECSLDDAADQLALLLANVFGFEAPP